MNKLSAFLGILLLFISMHSFAQSKKATKQFDAALQAYRQMEYADALDRLNKTLASFPNYTDAWILKADVYNDCDSTEQQIFAIKKALELDSEHAYPQLHYILANGYYKIGKYELATESANAFLATNNNEERKQKMNELVQRCNVAMALKSSPVPFVPQSLGSAINTAQDEYWPSLTIDGQQIVFTRLVATNAPSGVLMPRYQEDFFTAQLDKDSLWQKSTAMSDINTTNNEGAQSISANGKLLFFTACGRNNGYGSCDIYFSRLINGKWSRAINAGTPVNSTAWESQPSISANERYLYFSSSRKGGKGGKDIWRCELLGFKTNGEAQWGKAVNLGDSINTKGNEISPFIHPDGATLYFSSDTWPGLGKNDIFIARAETDSTWSKAQNIGYPINSYLDDIGFTVDAKAKKAYYSSKRPGAESLDLYAFDLYKAARPKPVSYVKGVVVDEQTSSALSAHINLININSKEVLSRTESANNGEFLVCLPAGNEYLFNVSKPGYLFYSNHFAIEDAHGVSNPYLLNIKLQAIAVGKSATLENVFFEYDSSTLDQRSYTELDRLKDFLTQNADITIEIGGHTDNNGSDSYNMNLSEQRAKAVYDYMLKLGIAENRMTYKGYGKTKPVATNTNAEGQALNRRTEFTITSLHL